MSDENMPKRWCLGFILDAEIDSVVLVHKDRTLHVGCFNGVGGRLEEGETPIEAMVRECREETGWEIQNGAWHLLGHIRGPLHNPWEVSVFATRQVVAQTIVDAGPEALILVPRAEVADWKLAPHTLTFVDQAYRHFRAIDPPEKLVVYDTTDQ